MKNQGTDNLEHGKLWEQENQRASNLKNLKIMNHPEILESLKIDMNQKNFKT